MGYIPRLAGISAVLLGAICGQTFTPAGSTPVPSSYSDIHHPEKWTGGAYVDVENTESATPVIHSFNETGQELVPVAYSVAGVKSFQAVNVAKGADGSFAVLSRPPMEGDQLPPTFLSWVSPDHQTITTTKMGQYAPFGIAVAPDGTFWTLGSEHPVVDKSHGVIRHFDQNGNQLGAFLPLSALPKRPYSGNTFVAGKDRVGWYERNTQDYYEVTFDGKVSHFAGVAKPAMDPAAQVPVYGLTLTDDNEVIVQAYPRDKPHQLYRLNRTNGTWVPIPYPSGTTWKWDNGREITPTLMGGDGKRVVFRSCKDTCEPKFFTFTAGTPSTN